MLRDNDAAIEWLLKGSEKNPALGNPHAYLAIAYALKVRTPSRVPLPRSFADWTPTVRYPRGGNSASAPAAYMEWMKSKVFPAWRKAGLPE
jgi:hypothetical protein